MTTKTLLACLIAGTTAIAGCARNPATGQNELMLVSQAQEAEMGQQADREVVASIGLYDDAGWQRYFQQLGERMAANSERPNLNWTFRVVDDPVVNAFAIPGGYIYVTRGILAHLNSEAELAAVVGHEIGHVTARHSAQQISSQQLAGLGLAIGSIVSPTVGRYAGLAQQALGVLFLKFSRDDENQADQLGIRYMTRTRYDVRQMPRVFTMLERQSAAAGGSRLPEWLATHPDPGNRRDRIEQQIARLPGDSTGNVVNRDAYGRRLDGMMFGPNPRDGYFAGGRFLHPGLRFQLTFPNSWRALNSPQAVQAMSPNQDAAIELTLTQQSSPEAAAQAFFSQQGIQSGGAQRGQLNGLQAVSGAFAATTQNGVLRGTALFVEHGGKVFFLVGYAPEGAWGGNQAAVEGALRSFAPLTDPAALNVQPQRLDVVVPSSRTTITELLRQRPSPLDADRLALLNQVEADTPLEAGRPVKWVTGPAQPR